MANLTALFVDGNKLNGNPLGVVNQLVSIAELYLEGNSFTGDLSGSFATNLLLLQALDMSGNAFTSTDGIPSQLFTLPNLILLDLSANRLAGPISDTIPGGSLMRFLSAYQNKITGTVPTSLTNLDNLIHIDLSNNKLTGSLDGHAVFTMSLLQNIFLSNNNFTNGTVPAMIGMTNLRELSLKGTNRVGTLPTFIDSPIIHLIDLDDNDLTGTIPTNYGQFTNLGFLLLSRNPGLTGVLPTFFEPTLTQPSLLNTVLVHQTGITGDFQNLCNLPMIKGDVESIYKIVPVVLADCAEGPTVSGITCECCYCCSNDPNTVCSEPTVDNLDWTWEYQFDNFARDFGLNQTNLPPKQRSG
jgi:uncharacterized protein YjbI with pentapeptide repeats